MRLETLFEKFDLIADGPNAVPRLREIILQFAVSGRLVRQSPSDSPVDVKRLSQRAEPRKQAEGRSGASLDAISEDEIAERVPESWEWVRLFRLCEPDAPIVYGILQPGPDVRPRGVPYVRPTEIKDGRIRLSEIRHTSPEIAAQYTRATIRKGDVLLTIVGTLGATAVVPAELDGGNITQSSCRLRPDARLIDTSYLVTCLRSRTLLRQYQAFSLGSAVQRLNIAHVRALAIPLPPLAEQKRIVAKVEELMAWCDRLEAQLEERHSRARGIARAALSRFAEAPTPANLSWLFHEHFTIPPADLRKAILTLAVQGCLVPQDYSHEPARDALRPVIGESRQAESNSGSEDLPFALPPGWAIARIGDILEPTRGISYGVIKLGAEPQRGGVFILRCSNVRFRKIDLSGVRKITEDLSAEYERTILRGGEVLINVRGTLGGCAVVGPELKGYNIAREVAVIPVHSGIEATYLMNVIASPYFQNRVEENLRGIAYEGLNLGLLRDFLVPIPPLAEQRRIVAKVDELMALVDELETREAAARHTATALLDALVAELTASAANPLPPERPAFVEQPEPVAV